MLAMETRGGGPGFESADFAEWLNLDGALEALSPSRSPNFHFSSASAGTGSPPGFSQQLHFDQGTESYSPTTFTQGERKRKASHAHGEGNGKTIKSKGKKMSHNVIEKRYRSNLNDKISMLRDSIPALRVSAQRASAKDGSSDTEDSGDGEGPTSKVKLNKATVLTKATEYIKQLERQNERLMEENSLLRNRLKGADSPPDSTIAVSYEQFKLSDSPVTDNTSSPPKMEITEDSSANTVAPVGMIKVPDDIARLRIGASEEHYAPDIDFSTATRGRYMSRLLLGSLATLMVMEGLSEVESDRTSNEPGSRGLFALPSELLRESRGFRDPIRRRIIAFVYSIQPHQTTSLLKLCFISIILFLVIISTFEMGRKSLRKSLLSDPSETELISQLSETKHDGDPSDSNSKSTSPVLCTTEVEAEDLSVTMTIRGFFARQALMVLGHCSWLQTDSNDEEAASLPLIRAEDFRRRWRAYAELLPKLLEETHAS